MKRVLGIVLLFILAIVVIKILLSVIIGLFSWSVGTFGLILGVIVFYLVMRLIF